MAYYLEHDGVKSRLVRGQWWLRWADGLTIGSWLFFRSKRPSPYLIAHEHFHAQSYMVYGKWRFLWFYLTDPGFRAMEEDRAHRYGGVNGWSEPFLTAAKMFGWTP